MEDMFWLYTPWAYALILIISLAGLALLDWRYRLLLWRGVPSRRAALATIGCLVLFFSIWYAAGIWLKIFFANPRYVLGLYFLTPDFPIEEVLFLTLLGYVILLVSRIVEECEAHKSQEEKHPKARATQ